MTNSKDVSNGKELLEWLLTLSKEELEKPVSMEGCDCYGDMGNATVDTQGITLGRS